jgi:hypothetical protein
MTLLLACAAFVMVWIMASGVAAIALGRMLHRADAAESRRIRRVSQLR